jgi:hypothetical protein
MPRGRNASYSSKQRRKAHHIEESAHKGICSSKTPERIAALLRHVAGYMCQVI